MEKWRKIVNWKKTFLAFNCVLFHKRHVTKYFLAELQQIILPNKT